MIVLSLCPVYMSHVTTSRRGQSAKCTVEQSATMRVDMCDVMCMYG